MAQYTKDNREEIPDPTPVEMPIGYEHPESLESMIARLVRVESQRAVASGEESFEESDDFDVDDDNELTSEYQMSNMQEEYVDESAREASRKSPAKAAGAPKEEKKEEPEVEKKAAPVATEPLVNTPAQ